MSWPVWDLPFAHGLLIATVAILHVFVSHFAIGGGLYLVVMEHVARRRRDDAMLGILERHARFFMLLTLVFGAISGVGIWFTIGLINPAGTGTLIRIFVWAWAIEWTFFVAEISAAMVYVYGWRTLDPRRHLQVGWCYFIAAWMSMVIINGILSFQLTPGRWLETHAFWDGFLNPTYFSSLAVRTLYAVALAGLFALWTLTGSEVKALGGVRERMVRISGAWGLVGLVGAAFATRWWWGTVPEEIRSSVPADLPVASLASGLALRLSVVLAVGLLVFPLLRPRWTGRWAAVPILAIGLGLMGSGEWVREALRKPWIVHGFLYVNGVRADEVDQWREEGIAARSPWIPEEVKSDPVALGEALFRVGCQNCHARTGYNGLADLTSQWDRAFIAGVIQRLEYTRRGMPPWVGTAEEADALAAFLESLKAAPPEEANDGMVVYERRCSPCHSLRGTNALLDLVEGMSREELDEYISEFESDYMPAFTGTERERALVAGYLTGLAADGAVAEEGS